MYSKILSWKNWNVTADIIKFDYILSLKNSKTIYLNEQSTLNKFLHSIWYFETKKKYLHLICKFMSKKKY